RWLPRKRHADSPARMARRLCAATARARLDRGPHRRNRVPLGGGTPRALCRAPSFIAQAGRRRPSELNPCRMMLRQKRAKGSDRQPRADLPNGPTGILLLLRDPDLAETVRPLWLAEGETA